MAKKKSDGKRNIVSVILAAGRGTRMQDPRTHKVCFLVDGKPVISRSIECYEKCGIDAHCVVVGAMADQVMESASRASESVSFVFQREQKGTGNAAKAAARFLSASGYDGDVLVVAGDKSIEESVVHRLVDRFYSDDCDLAFVVGDVTDFPTSGRIIVDDKGSVVSNLEVFDIARFQLLTSMRRILRDRPLTAQEAQGLAASYLKQESKAQKALGPLWDLISTGDTLTLHDLERLIPESDFTLRTSGCEIPDDYLKNARHANLSIYMFKSKALYSVVDSFATDNAQAEEYLTDAIGMLASSGAKIATVPLVFAEEAMAYNTFEELQAIREYEESKAVKDSVLFARPENIRLASAWLEAFSTHHPGAMNYLARTYGETSASIENKRRRLLLLLEGYIDRYGDEEVVITRSPGRVNAMGRHVDHQGGFGNMIAIDPDFYAVIGPRDDRLVNLSNLDSHLFSDKTFDISELAGEYDGGDWLDFVNSEKVTKRATEARGDWSQYVASAVVRLQARYPHKKIRGMNIMATGDIPVAAGLSSSSAIVVAITEAVTLVNDIDIAPEHFVELCGEAEWYVGTRGGAGDHAAMKFARRGHVVQVGFYPFGVRGGAQMPKDYQLVVCNSLVSAKKTEGARDIFNHRVACYHLGREIFKSAHPDFAQAITHLRDISTRNLGLTLPELFDMLKVIPENVDRETIKKMLPSDISERYLSTHSAEIDNYPLRGVCIYGLAECERSRVAPELLQSGDLREFAAIMNISHDGDRVSKWDSMESSWPYSVDYNDAVIDDMSARARDDKSERLLAHTSGQYSCSITSVDKMVDISLGVEGVLGAQILGAGLGGSMMVLVHRDSTDNLFMALEEGYYSPQELDSQMLVCQPVAGSGPVIF